MFVPQPRLPWTLRVYVAAKNPERNNTQNEGACKMDPKCPSTPQTIAPPSQTRSPSIALLPFFGEGSPTKIDYRKKGTLSLTSLLEDLGNNNPPSQVLVVKPPLGELQALSLPKSRTTAWCAAQSASRGCRGIFSAVTQGFLYLPCWWF